MKKSGNIYRKCIAISLVIGATFTPFFTEQAKAESGCYVGSTIFKDTLIGVGLGAVIGGLVLLAQNNDKNVVNNLATASLIGAGVGVGLGAVEIYLDPQCRKSASNSEAKAGFQLPTPVFVLENPPYTTGIDGIQGLPIAATTSASNIVIMSGIKFAWTF